MQHTPKRTRKTRETTLEREERKRKQEEFDPFLSEPLKTQGLEFKQKYPFTPQEVEMAFRRTGGIIASAAKILGIKSDTLYGITRRYPELQVALAYARDCVTDIAVDTVVARVREGDLSMIRFWLSRMAPGWEFKGTVETTVKPVEDLSKLSDEEIDARLEEIESAERAS